MEHKYVSLSEHAFFWNQAAGDGGPSELLADVQVPHWNQFHLQPSTYEVGM